MKNKIPFDLNDYLCSYSDYEQIYKRRYELAQQPSQLYAYLSKISEDYIINNLLLIPERLTKRFRFEGTEIWQNEPLSLLSSVPQIVIEKHPRYMAEFWHNHTFFEILYMYRGTCCNVFHGSGRSIVLREGECCIISPRITHKVGIFDDSILINIQIPPELVEREFHYLVESTGSLSLFLASALHENTYHPYIIFSSYTGKQAWPYLRDAYIEQLCCADSLLYSFMLPKIQLFLSSLIRYSNNSHIILPNKERHNLKKVGLILVYIEKNLQTVSLQSLAREFHFSTAYLSRLVRKSTGSTFAKIVQTLKLEYAAQLLKSTTKPVGIIAAECGYDSDEHFIRIFRKKYGQTPLKFRNSGIKNADTE